MVQGNFIGPSAIGTFLGNGEGVLIDNAHGNTIGASGVGPPPNLISGNGTYGVRITGALATGNELLGNLIGTQEGANTLIGLANGSHGVFVEGLANDNAIVDNTIAFNGGDGVYVPDAAGVLIASNSMYKNSELGIDLGADGVATNDPGDGDAGGNLGQNYPVLTSVFSEVISQNLASSVGGTLNSSPSSEFTLQFFKSESIFVDCSVTGFGEGQALIGSAIVVTNVSGDASFTVQIPGITTGQGIAATATDTADNTSEFSACVEAAPDSALHDSDGDGVVDANDVCPSDFSNDSDGDGLCRGDGFKPPKTGDNDNCPGTANPDQADVDGDGTGGRVRPVSNDSELQRGLAGPRG